MLLGGKINSSARDSWARYMLKWVQSYEAYGVDVWAITVQNEPESSQQWESCEYNASEEAHFVADFLGPTIKAAYPDLKILGFDHNKDHLREWASTLFDEKWPSADYFDGIAFHWYAGNCRYQVENVASKFPTKLLFPTEACYELAQIRPSDFDDASFLKTGSWARGEGYAYDILVDLQAGAVGWTDWNLLLDENGGPNHVHNFCDAPLLVDTRVAGGELHYHPQYYYLGHFSKFLVPGSKRLRVDVMDSVDYARKTRPSNYSSSSSAVEVTSAYFDSQGSSDCRGWPVYGQCPGDSLKVTTFLRPDNKIAIIVMNCAEISKTIGIDIDGVGTFFNPVVPPRSIQTYLVTPPDYRTIPVYKLVLLHTCSALSRSIARNSPHWLASLAAIVTTAILCAFMARLKSGKVSGHC